MASPKQEETAAYRAGLNPPQLDVLHWVSNGCPEGRYEGYSHRVSAAALRSRGLIRITGRGPTWQAEITERGQAVLDAPEPAQRPVRPRVPKIQDADGAAAPAALPSASTDTSTDSSSSKAAAPKPLSKTEQLIADIVAAGNWLTVPYWRKEGHPDYRQRALAAIRFSKVPPGQRLVMSRTRGGRARAATRGEPG